MKAHTKNSMPVNAACGTMDGTGSYSGCVPSSGHRANLLSDWITRISVGSKEIKGECFVYLNFPRKTSARQ